MVRHRSVWGEFSILLAVLVLGLLHSLEIETVEPLYRLALLAGVFYVFHLVSPIRIIYGARSVPFDLFMVFSFVLLAGGRAFAFLAGASESAIIALGTLLLGLTCWMASRDLPIIKHSALGAFRATNRIAVGFLLACGFFVMIFQPVIWLTLSLGDVPALRPVLSVLALVLLLQERKRIDIRPLARFASLAAELLREFSDLFMRRSTLLLGVTGLLVLQFAVQVGGTLLPAAAGTLTIFQGLHRVVGLISLAGTIALFSLPVYIWWKTRMVRKSRDHLPDWPAWAIGATLGCIVAALLFPLVQLLPAGPGATLVGRISGDPVLALTASVVVFGLCAGIGFLDDYLRRVLMMGPFLAAALFLGMYAYQSFVGTFLTGASDVLTFVTWPLAIPIVLLLAGMRVLFLVTGYLSFLYEVWRE